MFTNAGMNQFKDYFIGNLEPESRRVADTQKCLRVSGKLKDGLCHISYFEIHDRLGVAFREVQSNQKQAALRTIQRLGADVRDCLN